MHSLTLQFDSQKKYDKALKHFWDKLHISGELHGFKQNDKFVIKVISEEHVRSNTISKLDAVVLEDSEVQAVPEAPKAETYKIVRALRGRKRK